MFIPNHIPRISIIEAPTPLRRLSIAYPNQNVWIKDDSQTHLVYGGNKPRKLEFLLAKALHEKKDVLTFGFESSNHALATAYHAKRHGIKTHLVLVRGPDGLSAHDASIMHDKMKFVREFAHRIHVVQGFKSATAKGLWEWLKSAGQLSLIPPGGSSALGALGYVEAAFELKRQIEENNLPIFDKIFIPLGTAGTAVGLAVGLAAAGLNTSVVAVKVVPGSVNERPALLRLARKISSLVPALPINTVSLHNLEIEAGFLGSGYGQPLDLGGDLIEKFKNKESVKIEDTYTGKAVAALEKSLVLKPQEQILFWNTYSPIKETSSRLLN